MGGAWALQPGAGRIPREVMTALPSPSQVRPTPGGGEARQRPPSPPRICWRPRRHTSRPFWNPGSRTLLSPPRASALGGFPGLRVAVVTGTDWVTTGTDPHAPLPHCLASASPNSLLAQELVCGTPPTPPPPSCPQTRPSFRPTAADSPGTQCPGPNASPSSQPPPLSCPHCRAFEGQASRPGSKLPPPEAFGLYLHPSSPETAPPRGGASQPPLSPTRPGARHTPPSALEGLSLRCAFPPSLGSQPSWAPVSAPSAKPPPEAGLTADFPTPTANCRGERISPWSSHRGTVVTNPTSIHEDLGSIAGFVQWDKDPPLP